MYWKKIADEHYNNNPNFSDDSMSLETADNILKLWMDKGIQEAVKMGAKFHLSANVR